MRYTNIEGQVVAEKRNGVRRSYVPDAPGSTVALADDQQDLSDGFEYWPFGEQQARTGSTPTPFRFGTGVGLRLDSQRLSSEPGLGFVVNLRMGRLLQPVRRGSGTSYQYASNAASPELVAGGLWLGIAMAAAPKRRPVNCPSAATCGVAAKTRVTCRVDGMMKFVPWDPCPEEKPGPGARQFYICDLEEYGKSVDECCRTNRGRAKSGRLNFEVCVQRRRAKTGSWCCSAPNDVACQSPQRV